MAGATSVSICGRPRISRQLRDQIVLENLPLVKVIAIRVHENLPMHVDLEDLVHAGVLGLLDAVERFDEARNVAFQAYAKHRIKGAILDSLRQLDWASRDQRKRQKEVDATKSDLAAELGRAPTEIEMAGRMGVSLERWRRMQIELPPASAGAPPNPDGECDRAPEYTAAPALQPDRMCRHSQMRTTLARAIGTLPARYQRVVWLYYSNELTMKEIGEILGVNESRISQIHSTALKKMALVLESEGIRSAQAF
jgi:RNA polymerase sigma factor FliA